MTPIPGRAHTPEQKQAIVQHLLSIWLRFPNYRLGQLIDNAHNPRKQAIFYVEDEELVRELDAYAAEWAKDEAVT